jgi:xylulokinase
LGFDLSTQSLSITVIDAVTLDIIKELSINFDAELPHYNTKGGAIRHDDGSITSPTLMWLEAIDKLFQKLKDSSFSFEKVQALSASGQQHGSVYWKKGARDIVDKLSPDEFLLPQLKGAFSIFQSPIWMDGTTTIYCKEIEDRIGGPGKVAELTGSRCFERFTVNQIAKISRVYPDEYKDTERISLVSSFFVSLFIEGKYAPIDPSDGSGMNVMHLRNKTWIKEIVEYAGGAELQEKLGIVQPAHSVAGTVSKYWQKRYGIPSSCLIINASGDNPCTLAGLKLDVGDIAISLGTSSTVFGPLRNPVPSPDEGNIMCNPVDENGYMGMICYKNGALTREVIRDNHADKSWDTFSEYLNDTPAGNNGDIGFFYSELEIIPFIKGFYYFNNKDERVKTLDNAKKYVRGIVESQILSMYVHSQNIGLNVTQGVLVTGGSARNQAILQVISDVFGVPVYTGTQNNSASLGAAYKAAHGAACHQAGHFVPFKDVVGTTSFKESARPNLDNHNIYKKLSVRYKI